MRDSRRYLLEEVRLGSQGRVILGQVGRVASGGLLEPGKVWDETPWESVSRATAVASGWKCFRGWNSIGSITARC